MENEDKYRPPQRPMIFTGSTERQRANRTRACVYPGVCCSWPAAVEQFLRADQKLSCMYKPEREESVLHKNGMVYYFEGKSRLGSPSETYLSDKPLCCVPMLPLFLSGKRNVVICILQHELPRVCSNCVKPYTGCFQSIHRSDINELKCQLIQTAWPLVLEMLQLCSTFPQSMY